VGINANTIWPLNRQSSHGCDLDTSSISPYLISRPIPVTSDFGYVISDPGYVASSFGLTPSYKPSRSGAETPFPYPNYFNLGVENSEFGAGSTSPHNELNLQNFDMCGSPSLPAYYPGFLPVNDYYEALAATPLPSDYIVSGQLLNRYEDALETLQEYAKKVEREFNLNAWAARMRREAGTTEHARQKKFDFQEIVKLIEAAQVTAYTLPQPQILLYILYEKHTHRLSKNLWDRVQRIKRILHQRESRFCGLSWSRRFWFLLHGSHPPKTEAWPLTCQAFGCA